MKGFLTFTLAAGVAITSTSIAQAAGVSKGAVADKASSNQTRTPLNTGSIGIVFDRAVLNRELNRLNDLLAPNELLEEEAYAATPVKQKSVGAWTGL